MKTLYLEGNKGGDYIELKQYNPQKGISTVYIEVGLCCVRNIQHQLPVEFLTTLISNALMEANGDVEKMVLNVMGDFNKEYATERASQVKRWDK
jgi:hypothetical protein